MSTTKPPTKAKLSAHYRDLQRKSAAARWGKFDSGQRKAAMAALAKVRWNKQKGKL